MAPEALNPTIGGALIGSGAALIAVILTTLGTAATLRANRIAARDERLWERRTELYETLMDIGVSHRPSAERKELLKLQDSKVSAYASESVLKWYSHALAVSESPFLRSPEVNDILRTSLKQQDPDEYVARATVVRLTNTIRDELQGEKSRDLVLRARTYWRRTFGASRSKQTR